MALCRLSHSPVVYEELPVRARGTTDKGPQFECDVCGKTFDGRPYGSGLFLWHRGQEMRFEEPPLCEECATRVTMGALFHWSQDEED
jgi:hypothetical protein